MYGKKFSVPKLRKHQLSDADIVRLAKGLGSQRSRDTQGKNRVSSWLAMSGRKNMKAGVPGFFPTDAEYRLGKNCGRSSRVYSKPKSKPIQEPRLVRGDGACCSKCASLIKRGKMKPKATCDPCKLDRVIRESSTDGDLDG